MSELKRYLLEQYSSIDEAAEDIGVSRSTLYSYVNCYPERILSHIPDLLFRGKHELVAKSEGSTLVQAAVLDYFKRRYPVDEG